MSPRQIIASVVLGLSVFIVIIRLVQKDRLEIAYSWLWLAVGTAMMAVILKYDWLEYLTELTGAVLPTTTLFLFSIVFILVLCMQFSVSLSKHSREIRRLTQELALLSLEASDHRTNVPVQGANPKSERN
ncbi:MAG: DUF2304 domain-containing protein [Deltaproteobacteria bacterium]|nr:DUF2304 domain-containing protein [Deltaproteobacteria bacterium]